MSTFKHFTFVLQPSNCLPVAMESSYPPKEPKCVLFPSPILSSEGKLVPYSRFNIPFFPLAGALRSIVRRPLIYVCFIQTIYLTAHHLLLEKDCMNWQRSPIILSCHFPTVELIAYTVGVFSIYVF